MKQGTQSQFSGTTWRDMVRREVEEGFGKGGTHVYPWLIHVDVWQKPSQYCNYPPIKINKIFFLKMAVGACREIIHSVLKGAHFLQFSTFLHFSLQIGFILKLVPCGHKMVATI